MFTKLLAASAALTLFASHADAQMMRAVFLLDRSGSMATLTQNGTSTRNADSLAMCHDDVSDFFDASIPGNVEVMVAEFDDEVSTTHHYFHALRPLGGTSDWLTTKADALAAIGTARPCLYSTQLAHSLCTMVDEMEARISASSAFLCTSYFYVYSDGGENASTGGCAGTWDNDLTHHCPCDTFGSGGAYAAGSWQLNACNRICQMAGCMFHAVFNARKFNEFSTDVMSPSEAVVFRFLDSQAAQTGGSSVEVDDTVGYVAGSHSPFTALAGGCATASGQTLQVHATNPAQVNSSFSIQLLGTNWPLRFLLAGFAPLAAPVQFPFSTQACHLVIQPDLIYLGGLIPNITVPNNPSLAGANIYFQGLATDMVTDWVTSNGLRVTIQ